MNNKYIDQYNEKFLTHLTEIEFKKIYKIIDLFKKIKTNKKKIILFGNGGSSSIASHVAVDLTKICGIRAITFNESNLLTCFSNDFGYENLVSRSIDYFCDKGDLVILISSSGTSKNIINAARLCHKKKFKLITLNGFKNQNPSLQKYGDINLSSSHINFNLIENTHQYWLLMICDLFIKAKF